MVDPGASTASVTVTPPPGTQLAGYCGGPALRLVVTDAAGNTVVQKPRMYAQYCQQGPASTAAADADIPTAAGAYRIHGTVGLANGTHVDVPAVATVVVG